MRSNLLRHTLCLVAIGVLPAMSVAQSKAASGHPILPLEREIELALSAAPPSVSQGAAVWAFRARGFEKVRDGENGFNCLIQRANDVSILAPTCFDAEASRTIMEISMYQGELWARGLSAEQVTDSVAAGFRSGKLRPPARGAVGYMMSSGQQLGEQVGNWKPHMMIYAPYVTPDEIGSDPQDPKNPVFMLNPGRPDARIVVVVPEFIHPGGTSSETGSRPGRGGGAA